VVRVAAVASFVFVVLEAAIGAGIVLLQLVAEDASLVRGISMGLHLVNTFLLLGALTLTAWWSKYAPPRPREFPVLGTLIGAGFFLLAMVGMTGAIAALGDTLFPTAPYHAAPTPFVEEAKHVFLRLRHWHPIVAVLASLWWGGLAYFVSLRCSQETLRWSSLIVFLGVILQLGLGVLNVALRAPVWLQIVHLGIADLLLAASVIFSSELLRDGLALRKASHALGN
jgi:heme A synthase